MTQEILSNITGEIGSEYPAAGSDPRDPGGFDFVSPKVRKRLMMGTYAGVLLFSAVYFLRPEDLSPSLEHVPFVKIAATITGVALVAEILGGPLRLPREGKLLLALFGYFCLCVPVSIWVGGAYEVMNHFLPDVMMVIVMMWAVTTVVRLRTLLLVQVFAMLIMTVRAFGQDLHEGRMFGVGNSFGDPNELALNLCVILPFCVALLLSRRSWLWKMFWAAASIIALLGIIFTYSRGGFLALIGVVLAMCWRFQIRARTMLISLGLMVVLFFAATFGSGKASYFDRMETISDPTADQTGSSQARQQLLFRSLEVTLQHPFFGVGPGQFTSVSGQWHETHNSYTELTSEDGIPALILFLMLMWRTLRNSQIAQFKLKRHQQAWYLAGAVYAAMVGYLVGALFLSTIYWLLPYLLVAYGSSVRTISKSPRTPVVESGSTKAALAVC